MRDIIAIFRKEALVQSRYRITWINMALTPFFIIAPWIFTAKIMSKDFAEAVLVGSLIWYWLNQYFFGVQEAFSDEKEEGTLASLVSTPTTLNRILIGKGLWYAVECTYITVITLLIFRFLGFKFATTLSMFFLYELFGVYMFAFSLFWGGLILIFRRLSSINTAVQDSLGMLSGITADVGKYPRSARILAEVVPLTYAIIIARKMLFEGFSPEILTYFIVMTSITAIFAIFGFLMINYAERFSRVHGLWEKW